MDQLLETLSRSLIWNRSAILDGQVWRLLTAAMVHLSWQHALANVLGLAIWWRMEGLANAPLRRPQRVLIAIGGAILVHSILLVATDYTWYAGASATLYGLFAFTALRCGWQGGVMMLLLLGWLLLGGQVVDYSFPVARQAHWVGVAVGAGAAVLAWLAGGRLPSWNLPLARPSQPGP